ncbi:ATP-binding cassette domain-containing protein [Pedobacter alpinus]|uniref:ATP-binding cassette domain-containing protein n=1 Tax=Pedobacter alpinus TaxID=1590643 RepID=A0ABW5TN76_9SPHI
MAHFYWFTLAVHLIMKRLRFNKVRVFQFQRFQNDCGFACLKMICNYYGIKMDVNNHTQMHLARVGMNIKQLLSVAQQLGFTGKAFKFSQDFALGLSAPFMVISNVNAQNHAMVCFGKGSKKGKYIFADPAMGWLELDEQLNFQYLIQLHIIKPYKNPISSILAALSNRPFYSFHLSLLPKYGKTYFRLLVLSVASGLLLILITISIQKLIDAQNDIAFGLKTFSIFVLLLLLYFTKSGLQLWFQRFFLYYQEQLYKDYFGQLFNQIGQFRRSFLFSLKKSDYLAIMNDLNGTLLAHQIILQFILVDSLLLVSYFLLCFYYSFKIGICLLLFGSIIFLIIKKYGAALNNDFTASRASQVDAEHAFLAFSNQLQYGQWSGLSKLFIKSVNKCYQQSFEIRHRALHRLNYLRFNISLLLNMVLAVVVFMLLYEHQQGNLSTGSLASVFSITLLLVNRIADVLKLPMTLKEFEPHINRFIPLVQSDVQQDMPSSQSPLIQLSLVNYYLLHPITQLKMFKPLDVVLPKYGYMVITGANGIGKSLMLQSLFGFYQHKIGQLYWNDKDIEHLEGSNSIGYLMQQPYIWEDTLMYNITFNHHTTIAEMESFSAFFELQDFICRFRDGWHTQIKNAAIKLSVGETKMIGLLRELYKKPQLLILDEPTDSLSQVAKGHIISLLQKLKGKTTLLMISHDPLIISLADELVQLESP